jgi:hypothetical protein
MNNNNLINKIRDSKCPIGLIVSTGIQINFNYLSHHYVICLSDTNETQYTKLI